VIWCDDHLAALTIFQDEALLAVVVERRLGPLTGFRENQREPLADTLLSWLQHNMNANAVAADLHLHPQTVRRRLRQLDRLFGDQIHDSDTRFELEIALRAERAGRTQRAHRTRQAEPAQRARQPEPTQRARQPEPTQRARQPEPTQRARQPEPTQRARQTEPAQRTRRAESAVAPRRAERVTRAAVPAARRAH
jgi:hypothetical protein